MKLIDIKKYFGRRSHDNNDIEIEDEITKEVPMKIRGDSPRTTSFNRKLVIGLAGLFALIFAFSMLYGMSRPTPDRTKQDADVKDKRIMAAPQTNSQLDRLPSSYDSKNQMLGPAANPKAEAPKTENTSQRPQIPESFTMPVTPVNRIATLPPVPNVPQIQGGGFPQGYNPGMPTTPTVAIPTLSKEEQELAEARKSPIRFNLK